MKYSQKVLFLLRVSMGWLIFYAGITKVVDSEWSAAGYLGAAKTFSGFYAWFASPGIIETTNVFNQWGLTLIGAALIIGAFVRPAAYLGAIMMLLYYFPVLDFPFAGEHSFLIDDHIIYALVLLLLAAFKSGHIWGLGPRLARRWRRCAEWV